MKTCGTCFRFCEDWRDADAKGMKRVYDHSFRDLCVKPRKGIKVRCLGLSCPEGDEAHAGHPACVSHKYRWRWNLHIWWEWHFKDGIGRLWRRYVLVPIGGLRKPIPLTWADSFDGMRDEITPNGEPECPRCGEMPHSTEQCAFCGQRFLREDHEGGGGA